MPGDNPQPFQPVATWPHKKMAIHQIGLIVAKRLTQGIQHNAPGRGDNGLARSGIPLRGGAEAWVEIRFSGCHRAKLGGTTLDDGLVSGQQPQYAMQVRRRVGAAGSHTNRK